MHALYAVVFSLRNALGDENIRHLISRDECLLEMTGNLTNPLKNCQAVLGKIMVKIERFFYCRAYSKALRICPSSIKWVLFTKSEVRDLHVPLEAMKATLDIALTAISM